MRVLVLGSGVIGVTTAWYLSRAGHEVVVIDRQEGAGRETSFANAGQLSYGYSSPWAGPGVPLKAVKWLLMHHRPFVFWPRPDPAMLSWLARMAANCTERAYRRNKGRMVRVAEYSRVALAELRTETGIEFDHRARGTVQLFRTQKQLDHVGAKGRLILALHPVRQGDVLVGRHHLVEARRRGVQVLPVGDEQLEEAHVLGEQAEGHRDLLTQPKPTVCRMNHDSAATVPVSGWAPPG